MEGGGAEALQFTAWNLPADDSEQIMSSRTTNHSANGSTRADHLAKPAAEAILGGLKP